MPWALAISVGLRFSMSTASTTQRSNPIPAPPFARCPACLETSVHYVLYSHTTAPAIASQLTAAAKQASHLADGFGSYSGSCQTVQKMIASPAHVLSYSGEAADH